MIARALAFTGLALLLASCSGAPSAAPSQVAPAPSAWTQLSPKIRVNRSVGAVEFDAVSVLQTGFLEQLVCTVGTREHESLFAFEGKPSEIHAALLLAGLVPGAPGRWREVPRADGGFDIESIAPTGDELSVRVVLADGAEHPIDYFVRASPAGSTDPSHHAPSRFVFAGSRFHTDRKTGKERYVADGSGSLIGLVTFGDETIGALEVIPDQTSAAQPIWEVFSERMPAPGAAVRISITKARPVASTELPSEQAPGLRLSREVTRSK